MNHSIRQERVAAALRHAAGMAAAPPDDDRLRTVLDKVDRNAALWLAVDMKKLGLPSKYVLDEALIRPIFERSATVRGSLTCGKEFRLELAFEGRGTQSTDALNEQLKGLVKIVKSAEQLPFLFSIPGEMRPLLRLIADGEITRQEETVTLRSRLGLD